MRSARRTIGIACTAALSLLAACGGGSSGGMGGGSAPIGYAVHYLVADNAAVQKTYSATYADANLVNPWGLVFNPQAFAWIANQGTSTITLYDGNGVAQSPLVTVPAGSAGSAGPTGIVLNQSSAFVVSANGLSAASMFVFDGTGGTISGWSSAVSSNQGITAYDGGGAAAAFTGLAIAHDSNGNYFLYAADFHNSKVDVFDHGFTNITAAGAFVDPAVPQGYAPYGIQNIPASDGSAQIYVTYAQQDATGHLAVVGPGMGYLSVFDVTGNLIKHLVSGGSLNAPWGMALAPAGFGTFSGELLVGNFGDGRINAYNATTGALTGTLMQPSGAPVQVPGLWGIAFGNGVNSQPTTTLFFTAGVNSQADGVYGRIDYGTGAGSGSSGGGGGGY